MQRTIVVIVSAIALVFVSFIFLHVAAPQTQAQTAADVVISEHSELGKILTDADGNTLYLFTNDERKISNCSGGCAEAWPPLLTGGAPLAGEGLDSERLEVIDRGDGSSQVSYNGWPLYYYRDDASVGDANGQDRGDVWYVVSPFGGPIQTNAQVEIIEHTILGTMLVDRSGRSQYLFTRDDNDLSNCSGGCALAWPPLLTVGDPVAGEGLEAERLTVINREDGSSQVAYNGKSLYYYFNDEKPGDAVGQDRGDVWYVVSPFGGPIMTNAFVTTSPNEELGPILTDRSGRTLYLFTRDEKDLSNCSGGCALAWPPLLTTDAPVADGGVFVGLLGTTSRDDGSAQVTYDGSPLYYFDRDEKPGDTNGQDRGEVWFVVSTSGQAIQSATASEAQPTSPSVGDPYIPAIMKLALSVSILLILIGGFIVLRKKTGLVADQL